MADGCGSPQAVLAEVCKAKVLDIPVHVPTCRVINVTGENKAEVYAKTMKSMQFHVFHWQLSTEALLYVAGSAPCFGLQWLLWPCMH